MRVRASSRSTCRRIAAATSSMPAASATAPRDPQPLGLTHQRLQRGLQAVREVAGAGPGARHLRLALVEQRVDLGDQGQDLVGKRLAEPTRRTRAHRRHPRAHRRQRPRGRPPPAPPRRRSGRRRAGRDRERGRGRSRAWRCATAPGRAPRRPSRPPARTAAATTAAVPAPPVFRPGAPAAGAECGRPSRGAAGSAMVPSQSERDTIVPSCELDLPVEPGQRLLVTRITRRCRP